MIKALIIEDEEAAALRLGKIINEVAPDIEIIQRLDSIEQAVRWFSENEAPPLVFLDIQLADGLSFEIFKSVTIESFIVFTTAYDEYAIKAFELNSIDYLLKPVKKEKLAESITKFRKLNQNTSPTVVNDLMAMVAQQQKKLQKTLYD
jgi:DNA-binding LytR/AlgR family response regulator